MNNVKKLKVWRNSKEMYDKVKELRNVHRNVEDLSQIKIENTI